MKNIFPKVSFGTIIILFFFPFFIVKCGGEEVVNLRGIDLVSGIEIKTFSGKEQLESNLFAIISLASAAIGLLVAFIRSRKGKIINLIVSLIGFGALIMLYSDCMETFINKGSAGGRNSGSVPLDFSIETAYYWAAALYLITCIFFIIQLISHRKKKIPNTVNE